MANSPFLESIRHVIRTKHYSIQTEKTYQLWIKRFILFNQKRHPKTVFVFRGKGGKDRTTILPNKLIALLKTQLEKYAAYIRKILLREAG